MFAKSRAVRCVSTHAMVLLLLASFCGNSRAGVLTLPHRALLPSEVSAALGSLNGEMPSAGDVFMVGMPRYDDFFLKAAMVHGTLVIADSLSSKFGEALAVAANGGVAVPLGEPGKWADVIDQLDRRRGAISAKALALLQSRAAQMGQIATALPATGGNIAALLTEGQSLARSASQDFHGMAVLTKLPKVVWTLRAIAEQMAGDEHRAASTLASVQSICTAFSRHFGVSAGAMAGSGATSSVMSPGTATDAADSEDSSAPSASIGDRSLVDPLDLVETSDTSSDPAAGASPASSREQAFMPNLECSHLSARMTSRVALTCHVTKPDGRPAGRVGIEFAVSEGSARMTVGRSVSDRRGIATYSWPAQASFTSRQLTKKVYYYATSLASATVAPARASGDVLVSK